MNEERSAKIFALASKFGIPLHSAQQEPMGDATYRAFKEEYIKWYSLRDKVLLQHLNHTPTLFRVYLPYSKRVFKVASQVLWYLDEVIIRDPITVLFDSPNEDIEKDKNKLRQTIQFLASFKEPIEEGFMLLAGPTLIPSRSEMPKSLVLSILDNADVKEALQQAAYYGYTTRPASNGVPMAISQVELDSGGLINFHGKIEAGETITSPSFRIGETLPPIEACELRKMLAPEQLKKIENIYATEISRTISSYIISRQVSAAILYDREVDSLILSKADLGVNHDRQNATVGVLNLKLPYLEGVAPEHLL